MADAAESTTNGAEQKTNEELQEMMREFHQRAEGVRVEAIKQLNNAAETIRREAREAGLSEPTTQRADDLAGGLEKTANYLNSRTVEDMGKDATEVVKENPWQTIGVIFIIGMIIGLILGRK